MLPQSRRVFVELPLLMRAGLGFAVLGAVVDVRYHLVTDTPRMGNGSVTFIGHTMTLVGMVVTMLGLAGAALRGRLVETKPPLRSTSGGKKRT